MKNGYSMLPAAITKNITPNNTAGDNIVVSGINK
jgi:hypothetical protein